jgi:flagellar hook-length control protein FliK
VKTRFSDHLNDERRLSSDSLTDRPKEAGSQPSSAERPSSAPESSPRSDPEDGANENESQAEIADSSQEVPSEPLEGSRQSKTGSDAEDPARSDSAVADPAISAPDTESMPPVESSADLDPSDTTIVSTTPDASVMSSVPAEGTAPAMVQGRLDTEGGLSTNRRTTPGNGDASHSNQGSRLDENASVASGADRRSATPADVVKTATPVRSDGSNASVDTTPARIESAVAEEALRGGPARTSERAGQTADEGMASRPKGRSLSELLSRQGITMESEIQDLDPALGRVREINQTVAHEQAIRAMNGGATSGAPVASANALAGITETGTLEARTSVLSEVLSRSANEAKLVERATMITSRGMNALASQKGGSLTIRLDPPSLGQVMIRMSVSNGVVQAELHASNSAGRVVMERGLETLRASLESRGLSVERLSVQAATGSSESQSTRSESNTQDDGQQQTDKDEQEDGRQDAAGRESRGRDQERGVRSGHDDPNQNQQDMSFTQIMSEDAA